MWRCFFATCLATASGNAHHFRKLASFPPVSRVLWPRARCGTALAFVRDHPRLLHSRLANLLCPVLFSRYLGISMVDIVEVNDIEELGQYRMLWNSLFLGTPNATFFNTFDWLDTYWRHFGRDQKLRVLIVYSGGQPLGILPLCIRKEQYRVSNVRVLTYPLDNWGTWYGPVGPNPSATMLAAMQHLRSTPRDWDMMELRWVADDNSQGGKSARA